MQPQYRVTTNGRRYRVEVQYPPKACGERVEWEPYSSLTYPFREPAENLMAELLAELGEWAPVETYKMEAIR